MVKIADKRALMLAAGIRLVVFDVDGVLTDGTIQVNFAGRESRRYSVRDGHGFELLKDAGIKAIWMTRSSPLTGSIEHRANALGVRLHGSIKDKEAELIHICDTLAVGLQNVAFMGDDIFDIGAMRIVGFSACPADADNAVKEEADYVCQNTGGRGAAREVIELILSCHA